MLLAVYEDFKYADLYISDEKGVNYSLSLRNINPRDVIRSTNENVVYDLHKVNILYTYLYNKPFIVMSQSHPRIPEILKRNLTFTSCSKDLSAQYGGPWFKLW